MISTILVRVPHNGCDPQEPSLAKDELDLEEPQDDAVSDDEALADLDDPDIEDPDLELDDEVVAVVEDDGDEEEEEEDEDVTAALPDEDEEEGQASLEELLAQRAAARRGTDEADDDSDIMALSSEKDEPVALVDLPARATPIKAGEEFVCKNCFLVKPRVQLADEARGLCRDCV